MRQTARSFGSAGELLEPVAEEGRFGRAKREGGLVRGGEGGVEGEGTGGEAGVRGRGRVGGEGVDKGVADSRRDLRVAVLDGGADQRQGDASNGGQKEAGGRRPGRSVPY